MRSRLMLVVLFMIHGSALAAGSKIRVTTTEGKITKGELLSVREDALVVAIKPYSEYQVNPEDQTRIAILRFEDIKTVRRAGTSYTFLGGVVGMVGGILATASILNEDESTGIGYVLNPGGVVLPYVAGAAIGTFVGCAIGSAASRNDVVYVVNPETDFDFLKSYSRYPEDEPEVLQAVQYYSSLK